jgi:hypothetical protein
VHWPGEAEIWAFRCRSRHCGSWLEGGGGSCRRKETSRKRHAGAGAPCRKKKAAEMSTGTWGLFPARDHLCEKKKRWRVGEDTCMFVCVYITMCSSVHSAMRVCMWVCGTVCVPCACAGGGRFGKPRRNRGLTVKGTDAKKERRAKRRVHP